MAKVKVSTNGTSASRIKNVTVAIKIDLLRLANRVDLVFRGDDPDELIRGDQNDPRSQVHSSQFDESESGNIAPTSPWDCQALDQNRDLNIVITRCLTKIRHSGFPNVLSTILTTAYATTKLDVDYVLSDTSLLRTQNRILLGRMLRAPSGRRILAEYDSGPMQTDLRASFLYFEVQGQTKPHSYVN